MSNSIALFRQPFYYLRHGETESNVARLIVAHSGVFRVLCRTLELTETEAPVANALPLRFVPVSGGRWEMAAA